MSDKTTELLQKLASGQITLEDCQAQLNEKTTSPAQVTCKVTEKGCIGFYNLRRMPIVLYVSELERILEHVVGKDVPYTEEFQDFINRNKSSIKRKV